MPEVGQRLRVGGMVMPGSVQRDPNSLKVTFTIYDAEGSVDVSYEGILPDLFREGQGVVVQGELEKGNHILAKKCWRNTTKTTRRQKLRKRWKLTTVARRVFIRTQHHDAGNW
ncbi:cytochrome C-type biogenesis protein [Escherichia coli]|nr:cytochrome C-type biogenesis protein [Escherichia coli]